MARIGPAALEIGYWVDVRHVRRGVATEAAFLLTNAAVDNPEIARVEIHVDPANTASNAVPRRLGYRLDRTEPRTPAAPGDTGRLMIWIISREDWLKKNS
jgi:RimJ/RimL family protein N-acetyltransferase